MSSFTFSFRAGRKASSAARRRLSLDVSLTGAVYVGLLLFMGLAAMNSQANLLFAVFGLMVGVLLVSSTISRMVLRRLDVRRILPEHGVVGRRTTIQYELSNRKRFWPSLSVTLHESDGAEAFTRPLRAYMLHAAAGMQAVVPIEVIPCRRGLCTLNHHQLATSFPFGFIKRIVHRRQTDTLLVYPPIAGIDPRLLARCLSADHTGTAMRPRSGGTDEFYGVKEYRQGENPRFINWRRSARTGQLVFNEMTHVAPPRLLLFVDTFLPDRLPAQHASVERCIAMAGSLASHAIDAGLDVGLHAWSDGWTTINPSRGKRHYRDLMALLARLPLNTEHGINELLEHHHRLIRPGTTAVVITPQEVSLAMEDIARSNRLIISAGSHQAAEWFKFAADVDFAKCMPVDQEPEHMR